MVALVHDVNVVSAKKDGAVDFDAMCTIIVIDAHVILIIIIVIVMLAAHHLEVQLARLLINNPLARCVHLHRNFP